MTIISGKNMGGAYGGADFNPYDKSENEIQRFCQSYMTELSKYIGKQQRLLLLQPLTCSRSTIPQSNTLTYPHTLFFPLSNVSIGFVRP